MRPAIRRNLVGGCARRNGKDFLLASEKALSVLHDDAFMPILHQVPWLACRGRAIENPESR